MWVPISARDVLSISHLSGTIRMKMFCGAVEFTRPIVWASHQGRAEAADRVIDLHAARHTRAIQHYIWKRENSVCRVGGKFDESDNLSCFIELVGHVVADGNILQPSPVDRCKEA